MNRSGRLARRHLFIALLCAPVCALLSIIVIAGIGELTAGSAWAHQDISEAEDAVAHALDQSPRDADLYLRRATLERERHDWDGAAASYTAAAELGADRDTTDIGLAIVLSKAGLHKTALLRINLALDRHPESGVAMFTRARIHAHASPREAAEDYARAITALERPEPSAVLEAMDAQLARAKPQADVANGDMAPDKVESSAIAYALAIADMANGKLGIIPTIQSRAVDLEVQRKHYDAALARLDTLIAQAPHHEIWNARRGDLLAAKGEAENAANAYQHALGLIQERPPGRRSPKIKSLERELLAKLAIKPTTQKRENP